jgi:chemotaxis protein methyltransferase CheR
MTLLRLKKGDRVDPVELNTEEFTRFQQFIYETCGIRVPETKRSLLSNRIRRRVKAGGFDGFRSYLQHLTSRRGQGEIESFLDVVTTNETSFFRTDKHFDWFRSEFVPEAIRNAQQGLRPRSLRVWSAACSTGEEPYTLAICLLENQFRLKNWKLKVVGTDISTEAIQQAERGIYKERAMEGVDSKRRRRYFTQPSGQPLWLVRPAVKELVEFQRHNLIEPLGLEPFDCVLIRNVLIYFDRDSRQRVIHNLVSSMTDNAYLIVGPSEGIYDMLGNLKKHSTFLFQKTA